MSRRVLPFDRHGSAVWPIEPDDSLPKAAEPKKRIGAALVSRPTPTLDPLMAVVYAAPRKGRRRVIKTIRLEPEDWSELR